MRAPPVPSSSDENGDVAGIYSLNVVGDDGTWTPVE